MKKYVRKFNMLDSWTAVLTDPVGTLDHLLMERERPPYVLRTLIAIFALLFLPAIIYQYQYDQRPVQLEVSYAFGLTLVVTFIFAVLFNSIFLRMVGVTAPVNKILAAIVYITAPIIPIMAAYYFFNLLTVGNLSITVYLMSGRRVKGDWFLNLFPYFVYFTEFMCFVVLMAALRALGKMTAWSAFFTAWICAALFVISFVLATVVAGAAFPETPVVVWHYFRNLTDVPDEL